MKKSVIKKRKEIRFHGVKIYNKKGIKINISHPAYIFLQKDNLLIYVSITHSNHVEDYFVVQLTKNPNPFDDQDSFWVADVRQDTKENFGKLKNDWEIDKADDEAIRNFYDKQTK